MSVPDELKKFADLRDSGVLSEEEFESQKKKLLEGAGGSGSADPSSSEATDATPATTSSLKEMRELLRGGGGEPFESPRRKSGAFS